MLNQSFDQSLEAAPRSSRHISFMLLIVAIFALLAGCSPKSTNTTSVPYTDSGSSPVTGTINGMFVDDLVAGLNFTSSSGVSGTTDLLGSYQCFPGDTVTFSIGGVIVGSSECLRVITPLDLVPGADANQPQVGAIASFLQSLDGDGHADNGIIGISPMVENWIAAALANRGVDHLNLATMPADEIDTFTQAVVSKSQLLDSNYAGRRLTYVAPADAGSHLDSTMMTLGLFRRNVSGTPALDSDNPSLAVMKDVRVTPRRADGGEMPMCDNSTNCTTPDSVNPVLMFYLQPPDDKHLAKPFWGNDDAWVAMSLDNGVSWEHTNLSGSAGKIVPLGDDPYADVNEISAAVADNMVLATWISTYCPSENPMGLNPVAGNSNANPPIAALDLNAMPPEDIHDPAVYNLYDLYNDAGPQGVVDYSNASNPQFMYAPEVGKVAYHCVWAVRGVFNRATRDITWYAPEQITSGRRDANLNAAAGATSPDGSKGAFAITWQADPLGLSKGEGAGAGEGWCGSHTNKGTDIWYTAIDTQCFSQTGTGSATGSCYAAKGGAAAASVRPKAAYRMSAPAPVSNNAPCVLGSTGWNSPYCESLAKAFGTVLKTNQGAKESGESLTIARGGQKNPMCAVKNIERSPYWSNAGWPATTGTLEQQCSSFVPATNSAPLEGATGAARPRLQIVYDEGIDGMRALLTYEEHKALGFLCKNNATCQAERLDYLGKFVLFNSFPATTPDTVDTGGIINALTTNYMDTNGDGVGDTVRVTSDGTEFRYVFENARNAFLTAQDANNAAYNNGRIGGTDLRMLIEYKQGLFHKSQTSDLMLRRACGGYEYKDWGSCATAELSSYGVARDPTCMSCVTVTEAEAGSVKNRTQCSACHSPDVGYTTSDSAINATALDWHFVYNSHTDNNLFMDAENGISKSTSSYDPLDDIKGPWAMLVGDMVVVSYLQAANWPLAHHFKGSYQAYARRSFDGGFSWTSPDGNRQEGPGNLSNLSSTDVSADEVRLRVPEDCGFNAQSGAFACPDSTGTVRPEEKMPLVAVWCTGKNVEIDVAPQDIGKPVEDVGIDCYFALSPDLGETFVNLSEPAGVPGAIALLAVNHDTAMGANSCGKVDLGKVSMLCDGEQGFSFLAHGNAQILNASTVFLPSPTIGFSHTLYSTWRQKGNITESMPQNGIDVWYRQFDMTLK